MRLLFAGDPMCSWCYGFVPELKSLAERHPMLPLTLLMGGVRAGATDLLDHAGKQFRLGHWAMVEEKSGRPFNRDAFVARENFVYNTEPVCRAVVNARLLAPQANQLLVFEALQQAFYVSGRDTTDGAVLAVIAVGALQQQGEAVTVSQFHDAWNDPATIAATAAEFREVRSLGVSSFPQLLLEVDGRVIKLSQGYAKVDELDAALSEALRQHAAV
ncbi:DsbA family protein [Massilia sp. RP-1-19]|uniref:DsbA family protein n=1 Tax=Massilia polaris TaxID=2728846 RepID=A0A848HEH7_9BURK|nr:DsbA family protein [Massilia polaris]NML59855.1 DsbA family protein [Massilia polaris]